MFQHSKKKQRVKTIEFWIETARECFNVGNFNSLMAIIAGLNMSPISRLKKTVILTIDITYIIGVAITRARGPLIVFVSSRVVA